ncbi:hypothetical protein U0070_011070 [Myodes glareolus]|uniref:G-protein coupled receptors family 1 profile domain-containing protein n=1 Tax=Myodes glareolus TaxID=447135 RepID=A0AAW0HNN3_MYOGA
MYLVTVFGNLLIIMAIIVDSHLHTPMYIFLSNLSFVDICFTSTTVPQMLVNIQTQRKVITYAEASQFKEIPFIQHLGIGIKTEMLTNGIELKTRILIHTPMNT